MAFIEKKCRTVPMLVIMIQIRGENGFVLKMYFKPWNELCGSFSAAAKDLRE